MSINSQYSTEAEMLPIPKVVYITRQAWARRHNAYWTSQNAGATLARNEGMNPQVN